MIGGLPGVIAGGASGAIVVGINNHTFSLGSDNQVGYQMLRDGTANERRVLVGSTLINIPGEWVSSGASATVGDGFEVLATLLSGASSSGDVFGAWLQINAARQWSFAAAGSYKLEVRPFGGGTILDTATITITA